MQIGPSEIARRLNDQAESVCRRLLPHGKRVGHEWQAGDIHGSSGKSLSINLNKGVGQDFANPDSFSGDMLELWKQVKGISMREAIQEAKSFLGIEDAVYERKTYRKPDKPKCRKPKSAVHEYLTLTRMINSATLEAYKIGERKEEREIVFPFMSPDGELVACKYLGIDRDERGRKKISAERGCAPSFFGWQAMDPDAAEVIITEGEIDALTFHSMGFPALSVPNGTSSAGEAITYDWDNLQQFETIYLCPDNDRAGKEMVSHFEKRIGKARIRIIKLGEHKDANEARTKGWQAGEFREAIAGAKDLMADEILTPCRNSDEICDYILRGPGKTKGDSIPLLGDGIRLIPGHAILISGSTSAGKSQIIQQVAIELANHLKKRVAICSLESDCMEVIQKMVEIDIGKPSEEMNNEILEEWIENHPEDFIWQKKTGIVTVKSVLDFFEFSKSRFGCDHFILDNLTKLDTKADDYAKQAQDMNALTDWCRDNQVIVWALAHHKKHGEKPKEDDFTVEDIRGSSTITDLTSVSLVVYRNRRKEKSRDPNKDEPDTWIHCIKQRSTGKEPSMGLFLERDLDIIRLKPRSKIDESDIPPKPQEQTQDGPSMRSEASQSPDSSGLQGDEPDQGEFEEPSLPYPD